MRTLLLTLTLLMGILNAKGTQSTIDAQALEIKQLKRALGVKEQELKILLITIKNSKQESMLHTSEQSLEFKDVNNVSATRVVIKPSMLSETAIKEIDHAGDVDTGTVEDENRHDNSVKTAVKEANKTAIESNSAAKKETTDSSESEEMPKLSYITPSTFSLTMDADVYSKIFAPASKKWKKDMRFTSNKKRGKWIQITGKIDKGNWSSVKSDLWIDESCVKKVR